VEEFIHDCFNHYFDGRLKRDIEVEVQFKTQIDKGKIAGYCSGDRNEVLIEIAKDYKNTKWLCRNLAHEIIHAKQFIRGEINSHDFKWRKNGTITDCEKLTYGKFPWEIEAKIQERELVKLYYGGWEV
jgi:hypothetical protein